MLHLVVMIVALFAIPSLTQAEEVKLCFDAPSSTWLYTNKQSNLYSSCRELSLPELSTVPDRGAKFQHTTTPLTLTPVTETATPDVNSQVCQLYGQWLDLNIKTRGGMYYDARWQPLSKLFAGGTIPQNCKQ